MHPSGFPDAAMFDAASEEWRLVCYARWICRRGSREARLAWFERIARRHPPAFVDHLKRVTQEQWATRALWDMRPRAVPAPAAAAAVSEEA